MKKITLILLLLSAFILSAKSSSEKDIKSIAIFIPGVTAGSPIYEELVAGATLAADESNITTKVIEGGFNTAEWEDKVKEIAATGLYDLIISSNPSMPEIADHVSKQFPNQKFLILDGKLAGNDNIYTAEYKQYDQAYMAGYLAGLVTTSSMEGANPDKKAGLIIAYHYPVLDDVLIPGFKDGLKAVDPEITVDIKAVGNWWDATKASELTSIMIDSGCDVFLSISGGATQGVISKCQDRGKYLVHFDSNGYDKAPGTVVGSTILRQKELTYKLVKMFINGKLPFGKAETFSAKDGYIDFIEDDELYISSVPEDIRNQMAKVIQEIKK